MSGTTKPDDAPRHWRSRHRYLLDCSCGARVPNTPSEIAAHADHHITAGDGHSWTKRGGARKRAEA